MSGRDVEPTAGLDQDDMLTIVSGAFFDDLPATPDAPAEFSAARCCVALLGMGRRSQLLI